MASVHCFLQISLLLPYTLCNCVCIQFCADLYIFLIIQVYLLAHDLHKLLAALETKFLTIFLDGHFDSTLHSELIKVRKNEKDLIKVTCVCPHCQYLYMCAYCMCNNDHLLIQCNLRNFVSQYHVLL